jgi:hypothetical protein
LHDPLFTVLHYSLGRALLFRLLKSGKGQTDNRSGSRFRLFCWTNTLLVHRLGSGWSSRFGWSRVAFKSLLVATICFVCV